MYFTQSKLTALLQDDSQLCISLFMPMAVTGRDRTGNRLRFKNLIHDAKELLRHSIDKKEVDELLRPLNELHDQEEAEVWQHPTPGPWPWR